MPVSRTLALEARDLQREPARRHASGTTLREVAARFGRTRRAMAAATLTLATAGSLATANTADAAASYCSPTGDFCTSVAKKKGVRNLAISTFAHRGSVQICVSASGAEPVCKARTLKGRKGLYSASVKWSANYPRKPKGLRSVTFEIDGARIGPALSFTAG